jgi:hypothetical protein
MFGLLMKKAKGIPFSFQFFFGCRQANGFMGVRENITAACTKPIQGM